MRGMPYFVAACVFGLVLGTGALAADESGSSADQSQSGSNVGQSGSETSGMSTGSSRDQMSRSGQFRLDLAANVIGSEVMDSKNEKLGKLKELAIDPELSRIAYGVLEAGGTLGIGEKYFAVPFTAFNFQHKEGAGKEGKIDHLALNIDKNRFKNAPGFDKNNWPDMANQQWATNVHEYYNQQPYWQERGTLRGEPVSPQGREEGKTGEQEQGTTGGRSDMSTGRTGAETGRMSGMATGERRILKADADIRGRTVKDSSGNEIGKVSDLLISEHSGDVPFVLLKLNDPSKFGDKNNDFAALPFKAVNWSDVKSGSRQDLTLTISSDKIKGETFSNNNWPDLSNREWASNVYRHYGMTPSWERHGGMMGGTERGSRTQ